MSFKTIGFGVVVFGLVSFLAQQLMHELTSPEEKIRFALEDAVDDLNDRDMDAMGLFHRNYEDSKGFNRDSIRDALHFLLLSQAGYRVELKEAEVVSLSEDESGARVNVSFAVYHGDAAEPWWDASGRLDFERRGRRWRVARSSGFNHQDRPN
ncbi:MAG: hypothetical protein O2816_05375 [Planctomycetota bacterium]|nr:hypothetical protein [Planctomycetota bacterium]